MKDKFLYPSILISLSMILTVLFAYSKEEIFYYFAAILDIFALLNLIDKK